MGRNLRARYFVFRSSVSLLAIFLVLGLSFLLVELHPSSPIQQEREMHPTLRAALEAKYGLNASLDQRFIKFLQNTLTGQLGPSMLSDSLAEDYLSSRFRNSATLGILAFSISILLSLGMALAFAYWKTVQPQIWSMSHFLISIPTLVLVPCLIYFFGLKLELLPVARLESWSAYLLPTLAISYRPTLHLSRLLMEQIEKCQASLYFKAHRSLGFSFRTSFLGVILRNSLIPYLAAIPAYFSSMVSGSIVIETMFAIPGLGSTYMDSLLNRDVYLILGLTVIFALILIALQWLVDMVLLIIDPRLDLQ